MKSKNLSINNFYPDVVIVGVGFVGLTLSMALCERDFRVLGIDSNHKLVDDLSHGRTKVVEPGIEKILEKSLEEDLFKIIKNNLEWKRPETPITFILTVGTPLKNGYFDNSAIISSLQQISVYLRDDDLLILRSTVAIGTSRKIVFEFIKNLQVNVCIAMCPERTIEGNALVEISTLPQIIGGIDEKSAIRASEFFQKICESVLTLSSIESAEFLKLANNSFRDLSFAFANELTSFASKLGISSLEIINAANYKYPRSKIALPGPSGGPCLEKDPWILVQSALNFEIDLPITRSAREVNERVTIKFVLDNLEEFSSRKSIRNVGLLGLSFKAKPLVRDSRGSFALLLEHKLKDSGYKLLGYEPAGTLDLVSSKIELRETISSVLADSDVIVISTNHEEFEEIPRILELEGSNRELLVIDMWSVVRPEELSAEVTYKRWG